MLDWDFVIMQWCRDETQICAFIRIWKLKFRYLLYKLIFSTVRIYCSLKVHVIGTGSSVGIATVRGSNPSGARFSVVQTGTGDTPNPLYNGYRVFPGGRKRPGRDADPSPPPSAEV